MVHKVAGKLAALRVAFFAIREKPQEGAALSTGDN